MSEVIITVRGESEARVAPEEAVASITVAVEGPDRGGVVERIAAEASPLRDDLAARKGAGGVTEWSSQRAAVWSDRPWNSDGRRLPLVHHASVELTATFRDFAALSWWLTDLSERESVQVQTVQWRLTRDTASAREAEVAASAVRVAVDRATAYAAAIGLATVTPREVADVGLLARADQPAAPLMMRAAAMSADNGRPALDLQPQDVVITAGVEARFAAR